jgi:acetyl-CoA carboxylase biotin carboxyl carrier protein
VSLTAAEVAEIMRMVEQSTFDELTLEMNGVKLTLKRGAAVQVNGAALQPAGGLAAGAAIGSLGAAGIGAGGAALGAATASGSSTPASASHASANGGAVPSAARPGATTGTTSGPAATYAVGTNAPVSDVPARDASSHDVPSPLLGTFYRSPKPGAPPFVEVGAKVEEDTVIAIIEVMKLMNTVRAGTRGTVTDIFAADGALVEFDQPLIRVRKSA